MLQSRQPQRHGLAPSRITQRGTNSGKSPQPFSNAFERFVLDVRIRRGYGGNRRDAAKALGRSGDGGVDADTSLRPIAEGKALRALALYLPLG